MSKTVKNLMAFGGTGKSAVCFLSLSSTTWAKADYRGTVLGTPAPSDHTLVLFWK